ncbi:unnamed protein product [Meganyctiphanes norvegica]|uniref:Uncharacterized protein n=1 Tax=Meganyctiphanes norvegica TaxID=48144 RepID=A0AAV2SRD1_MEGNR
MAEVSGNVTDETKGDAACDEIGRTSIGTNTPGNSGEFIRTCRHMGMTQSSPLCEICTLIKSKYSAITPAERRLYSAKETDYREQMDDNGMVTISVPVEHRKTVENYVNAMIALDYVQRNHADILLYSCDDTNEIVGCKRKFLKK